MLHSLGGSGETADQHGQHEGGLKCSSFLASLAFCRRTRNRAAHREFDSNLERVGSRVFWSSQQVQESLQPGPAAEGMATFSSVFKSLCCIIIILTRAVGS